MFKAIFLFLLILPSLLLARPTRNKEISCKDKDVKSFKSHDHLKLKYRRIKGRSRAKIDSLQLHGGPGSKAIEIGQYVKKFSPRRTFMMDLRGTHCNKLHPDLLSKVEISTDSIIQDWVTIARKEKIKKVLIHGLSFGTVLSVKLADAYEKIGIDVIGVIQDGTVGNYKNYPQFSKFYNSVWKQHIKEFLSSDYKKEIDSPKPYGFTHEEFSKLAELASRNGYIQWKEHQAPYPLTKVIADLKKLSEQKSNTMRSWLRSLVSNESAKKREDKYVYKKLSCVEINPSGLEYQLHFSPAGNLNTHPDNLGFCQNEFPYKKQFYPQDYSFDAPILFIEGSLDPNTPIFGALTQAQAFDHNKRTLLLADGGGHGSLLSYFKSCQLHILKAMYEQKEITNKTLSKCASYKLLSVKKQESLTHQSEYFENVMIWYNSKT